MEPAGTARRGICLPTCPAPQWHGLQALCTHGSHGPRRGGAPRQPYPHPPRSQLRRGRSRSIRNGGRRCDRPGATATRTSATAGMAAVDFHRIPALAETFPGAPDSIGDRRRPDGRVRPTGGQVADVGSDRVPEAKTVLAQPAAGAAGGCWKICGPPTVTCLQHTS
jgi:hypothetical protein